jgi:hypothetical protein
MAGDFGQLLIDREKRANSQAHPLVAYLSREQLLERRLSRHLPAVRRFCEQDGNRLPLSVQAKEADGCPLANTNLHLVAC